MTIVANTSSAVEFEQSLSKVFGNVRIAFGDTDRSSKSIVSSLLGACRLTRIETTSNVVINDFTSLKPGVPEHVKVLMQHRGVSILQQGARSLQICSDQIAIYDPARPFVLKNVTPVSHFVLQIPRQALSAVMLTRLTEPFAVVENNSGMQSVLLSLVVSTLEQLAGINASSRNSVGQMMVDAVRTLLFDDSLKGKSRETSIDILRRRIKNFIRDNIENPDLDAKMIAAHLRCCVRYVYRAFEHEHDSLGEFIWNMRLETAASRLQLAGDQVGGISAVAFETGFCSSAHFSRAFRKRFGLTPSEWRRTHARHTGSKAPGRSFN